MSKIIIHNNSSKDDKAVAFLVYEVIAAGFVSGQNQYCWMTHFETVSVHARPTRGTTHTFEVRDL